MNYSHLLALVAPETIVVLTALLVLAVDMLVMREQPVRNRLWLAAAGSTVGCLFAVFWLFKLSPAPGAFPEQFASLPMLRGMMVDDGLVRWVKAAVLGMTVITILLSVEADFTRHTGEYFALILFATVGMMFLVSAEDLLMIFLALELTSLSLYVLTAFNKREVKSVEAALKYFLFGAMSAAFTLFGLSLVYGLAGSTDLRVIARQLDQPTLDPLLATAIVMVVIGFGFKIAAVPFHLWAPDAYQGAPTPSAALIASGSKVASFFVLAKVMVVGFANVGGDGAWRHFAPGWMPIISIVAVMSMAFGNVTALAQSNVKRLLAYSAIAHGGYALLAILANGPQGITSLVYYVVTYGITVLGAFGVVGIVERNTGGESRMSDFAGLSRRDPLLALCMLVFMLSLAGIPPLAGFFGKFFVFTAAAAGARNLGWMWLVIFAIGMSAVSLYYYLQVLKQIYVAPEPKYARVFASPIVSKTVVCAMAAAVVILGCLPDILVSRLLAAIPNAGF